ncbi:MAG TPA: hypothetical protein VGA99_07005 [bacterium]
MVKDSFGEIMGEYTGLLPAGSIEIGEWQAAVGELRIFATKML